MTMTVAKKIRVDTRKGGMIKKGGMSQHLRHSTLPGGGDVDVSRQLNSLGGILSARVHFGTHVVVAFSGPSILSSSSCQEAVRKSTRLFERSSRGGISLTCRECGAGCMI
eukprot:scaffold7353_cov87-Cylindrotheca_fusiformis.AAC.8